MALHPVKLPQSSRNLRKIVALQRLLLKALCSTTITANNVNRQWLESVWSMMAQEWVKQFCRKRKGLSALDSIKGIAGAPVAERNAVYQEFCRQNRVRTTFEQGGNFRELGQIPQVSATLATHIHAFFVRCYEFLGEETTIRWRGYQFSGGNYINKQSYKDDFRACNRDRVTVCPYCDGPNDKPQLDHYYPKGSFPLLSCSAWNLVPVCSHCNGLNAKDENKPLTPGIVGGPASTSSWLHPFFRPASLNVNFEIEGPPGNPNPKLQSSTPGEQASLDNHTSLIPGITGRWQNRASDYFDRLVTKVRLRLSPARPLAMLVQEFLDEHEALRGKEESSMVYAGICRAVLCGRSEYQNEFSDSNPPTIA